jgi:hypothetical protein
MLAVGIIKPVAPASVFWLQDTQTAGADSASVGKPKELPNMYRDK